MFTVSFLALVSFLPLAISLECFKDVQRHHKPPNQQNIFKCEEGVRFCVSQTVASTPLTTYLCDDIRNPVCRNDGCTTNMNGEHICCCSSNTCNNGFTGANGFPGSNGYIGPNGFPGSSTSRVVSVTSMAILLLVRA